MADEREQIRIVMEALEGASARLVVGITLEVHSELVVNTPVDLGWARANWVPNIGSPGPSSTEGDGETASASARQQSGVASVAAGYRSIDQGRVHITNNVPYIEPLNAGSSKQAPAGFVEAAIHRGVRRAQQILGGRV